MYNNNWNNGNNNINDYLAGYNPNINYTKRYQNTSFQNEDSIMGSIVNSFEDVKSYAVSKVGTCFLVLRDGTKAWSKYLNENGVEVITPYELKRLSVEPKQELRTKEPNVLKPDATQPIETKILALFNDLKKDTQKQLDELKKAINSDKTTNKK